ncbi:30S ribosomal protein S17 [Desulfoferrobacter suflitae]|uniref:30S ribosomal protein S17 n=1 Tax=Desulfoferrobacter suflitae TaxID=2865782 RepID=UPI00338E5613
MEQQKLNRKVRLGTVISNKMDKTVVVTIERLVPHPMYRKYIQRRSKLKAHDSDNSCQIGDRVLIEQSRPLSKTKRWTVVKIVERAAV